MIHYKTTTRTTWSLTHVVVPIYKNILTVRRSGSCRSRLRNTETKKKGKKQHIPHAKIPICLSVRFGYTRKKRPPVTENMPSHQNNLKREPSRRSCKHAEEVNWRKKQKKKIFGTRLIFKKRTHCPRPACVSFSLQR